MRCDAMDERFINVCFSLDEYVVWFLFSFINFIDIYIYESSSSAKTLGQRNNDTHSASHLRNNTHNCHSNHHTYIYIRSPPSKQTQTKHKYLHNSTHPSPPNKPSKCAGQAEQNITASPSSVKSSMPLDLFLEVIITIITLDASRLLQSLRDRLVERMLPQLVRERAERVIVARLIGGGIEGV